MATEVSVHGVTKTNDTISVADPGFPVGGHGPVRGTWTSDAGAFQ